ncbi:ABC transporter related protein [Spirochaeta thermophila DSM 6578]|uniref:ABC transporter related protein n=1 Tax=Winmispira thermophila (strain ATCC 700085 / DSM 6578 / Z-1203) TaxID=869211 RepID=G0GAS3_WINT7|nr:ABC transporter ATP-binding protein [Spirochaeta thermophila]AEJ61819.1 ABC transporter related protein [Spirochaeta thermophila DSM 6578]
MALLSVRHLSLTKEGKTILHDVCLDIEPGYVYAVVGPNGAGKSSLAAVIMGLHGYREIEGEIIFEGERINDLSIDERARRGITLAWQEPARFDGLPVREYLRLSAKGHSDEEAEQALMLVGLDPARYLTRKVDQTLSGGERKRVELAAVVAMRPKLALLDEPDSGVDIDAVERIFDVIRYLKEQGTTVVLVTHSAHVLTHADRAFLMCNGKLLREGTVEEILPYFSSRCYPCNHPNSPVPGEVGSA